MRALLFSALLVCALPDTSAAAAHRLRVYPNPSIAVNAIAESPDGFLWLAAADGLYRFDGLHYDKIPGFPFASARFVVFTRDGSLWCGGQEGLTRFHHNRFDVLSKESVIALAAYPDEVFVRLGLLTRFGLDGSKRNLSVITRKELNIDQTGRLWAICIRPERGCWIEPKHSDEVHSIDVSIGYDELLRDSQGRLWAADAEQAFLLQNGRGVLQQQRLHSREKDRLAPLLPGRNGQLWFLGETVRGLISPIEFRDRPEYDRFSPMAGLEDSRGHFWTAPAGRGLIEWIPDAEWRRWFPEDIGNDLADHVVRSREGQLILATQKRLFRQDPSGEHWLPLTREEHRFYALYPLESGGFLASVGKTGSGRFLRLSAEGKVMEEMRNLQAEADQYRKILRDGKGRFWVGSKRTLLRLEGQPGSFHFRTENLPDVPKDDWAQAVDLELDALGRLWVGYEQGIAWLDGRDRWHKLVTDQPVTSVRSFVLAGDDIWVAHRRSGSFTRLHQNGDRWIVTSFSARDGYTPADTYFIKRDSRGWIWRGSDEGVHISDGRHVAPGDWLHIHRGSGLAGEEPGQYSFFEDTDRSVWIVAEDGVSHLHPRASWFDAPHSAAAPQITRVEADGRVWIFPENPPQSLPAVTKVLRIDIGTRDASPFRDFPLRYRLLPAMNSWQSSRDGTLEFHNLPADLYTLELGYTGNGPSAIRAYPFRVGAGARRFPWPWLVSFLVGGAALVTIVRRVPAFDRIRFRVEKAVFMLRRRYGRSGAHNGSGVPPGGPDYAGATLLGRYRLSRIVSRGGFSVVYEGRDIRGDGGRVAVKVINRGAGEASWLRDRFAHEVAALRSVEHPGVVPILDSWISSEGEPCLAMPFLDGQTLRLALRQAPFATARVARLIEQLGSALQEVHGHGIVHRDLKPENVILVDPETEREQTVIIDFGTAGLRTADNELAATTLLSGSFYYMAPERLTGRYSPASDVFSMGVIILEMLTGKRLADLSAMFSDPAFAGELEKALRACLDERRAKQVADMLAPAYDLEPRRRPAAVKPWAEELARALLA